MLPTATYSLVRMTHTSHIVFGSSVTVLGMIMFTTNGILVSKGTPDEILRRDDVQLLADLLSNTYHGRFTGTVFLFFRKIDLSCLAV